ncbi:MAG TPA: Fe-S metabolism protein SufE [Cytophagales bacterium]|nr:Fe-S metabolism protein SufE [Cytophagales bacterium]HAA19872.1 Fe-S metabolism protein SufE [Cytophagales bacterium]HAP59194.1 Fe-S metabolism protein SufE [Cytophagales bacterium]
MASINETQDELIGNFELLGGDFEMTLDQIMDLGKKLPALAPQYQTEENIVKGCQSKVWLHTELDGDKIKFEADSNTEITKGLVSMLVSILSNHTPEEILAADLYFIEKIGLHRFIGTQRSNGFGAMIKQMKDYATAYKVKLANS